MPIMHITDYIVLISVLITTLCVGLYAGRHIQDIDAFAVGSRKYGFFALFSTLSASYIGGGYTFGISEEVFRFGLISILCLFGFSLQQILVSIFIAPRMTPFYNSISVGDIMYQLYGKWGRIITGIASAFVCAGITGAQIGATGYVFQVFLGIDQSIGILIGCSIVLTYAIFGGIKAVISTDILQFCILIIAIPMTLIFSIYYVGSIQYIKTSIPETFFQIPGSFSWTETISLFLSLLLGEALVPPYVQRLFIAKNIKTSCISIFSSGLLSIPFFLIAGSLGIIAFLIKPDMNPNMALPFVIKTVLPVGIKGFSIAGIICVIMSSADSFLNASAISIVHDIIKPLRNKSLSNKKELSLTRWATFVVGVGSIIFALSIKSVLHILLYSYNFWAPIILTPLVFGIFGQKISFKGFLIAGIIGFLSVCIWNYLFKECGFDGLVIGVIFNLITFIIIMKLETLPLLVRK